MEDCGGKGCVELLVDPIDKSRTFISVFRKTFQDFLRKVRVVMFRKGTQMEAGYVLCVDLRHEDFRIRFSSFSIQVVKHRLMAEMNGAVNRKEKACATC